MRSNFVGGWFQHRVIAIAEKEEVKGGNPIKKVIVSFSKSDWRPPLYRQFIVLPYQPSI